MTRARRIGFVMICLFLTLALLACGAQPSAAPASSTEQPRSAETPDPTEQPRPTEGARPTEQPPPPTASGAVTLPNVAEAYERARDLPGYHFEGTVQGQGSVGGTDYLRLVQDVDAQGNMHLQAFDEVDGAPTLDMYYVDKHLYMGAGDRYIDMGVQEMEQASTFYQLYQAPFMLVLAGATNLEAVGREDVAGLAATKYRASFEEWVRTYIQVRQGVTYTSEGYIWISDEYGAIVKTTVQVAVTEGAATKTLNAESEISQVGQVASIAAPK
jgi:hypothetical protein